MSFQPVESDKYLSLKRTLENRLPKSAMAHNVLQFVRDGRLPPSIATTIYTYEGRAEEAEVGKEVFCVAIQFRDAYKNHAVILSAPDEPTDEMNNALNELIDWKLSICFCAVDDDYSKNIEKLCMKNGVFGGKDPCDFMTISIEEAKRLGSTIKAPPQVEIKELSPSDGDLVTKRWKFAQNRTEVLMRDMIKHIGSSGVYYNNKLVSWVVIFAMGSVNALYTEDDYRGKGYARLTMQKLCQIAGERGIVPNVQVELGNIASKKLMKNLGFTDSHRINWMYYKPQRGEITKD